MRLWDFYQPVSTTTTTKRLLWRAVFLTTNYSFSGLFHPCADGPRELCLSWLMRPLLR